MIEVQPDDKRFDQRATFYFSEAQLLALEVLMLKLRTEQRVKVGKSQLMRLALNRLLAMDRAELASAIRRGEGGDADA